MVNLKQKLRQRLLEFGEDKGMNLEEETKQLLQENPLKLATRGMRIIRRQELRRIARLLEIPVDSLQSLYLSELAAGEMLPPILLKGGA